jgi:hypothetical protein
MRIIAFNIDDRRKLDSEELTNVVEVKSIENVQKISLALVEALRGAH